MAKAFAVWSSNIILFPPRNHIDNADTLGYTLAMTTSISISDTILHTADQLAQDLGISRNELFENAVRQYVESQASPTDKSIRERFNAVYSQEDSTLDPLFVEIQARSLPQDEG